MTQPEVELERKAIKIVAEVVDEGLESDDREIARRCQGNESLSVLVHELITSGKMAEHFLAQPARQLLASSTSDFGNEPETELPEIDSYRIKEVIGVGGMGSVYLAEDLKLHRQVAIKLVRFGTAIPDYARRLRKEANLLARLHHPNIASIVTADVTKEGVPFFVMEYVDGLPIDTYCDQNTLPIRKRLRLFLEVCEAVQHAHQRLIVHRDLKPSNVLVANNGQAKLLDFGIAKLLEQEGHKDITQTVPGRELLTPSYASPEQRKGEPVTTTSDVFSLGVILHELLIGQKPDPSRTGYVTRPSMSLISSGDQEEERRIATARASSPDRLKRDLAGDLDNICTKALEADPDLRYQSAQQFLDDIVNYLGGRPVQARAPSRLYRAHKFVRRNAIQVAASTIVLLSLLGGSIAVSWQASIARAESVRANRVKSFLVDIFRDSDPNYAQSIDSLSARDILSRGYERVMTEFEDEPEVRLDLLSELSSIYLAQGASREGEQLSRQAILERRRLFPNDKRGLAAELARYGGFLRYSGKTDSAIVVQKEAWELANSIDDVNLKAQLATSLASNYHFVGDFEKSNEFAEESISLFERIGYSDTTSSLAHARALKRIGMRLAYGRADTVRAFAMLRQSLHIRERDLGRTHPETISSLASVGSAFMANGRNSDAVRVYTDVLERSKIRYEPMDAGMSYAYWDLGHAAKLTQQFELSIEMLGKSISIDSDKYGPNHYQVLSARLQLADVYRRSGNFPVALDILDDIIPEFDDAILYKPIAFLNRGEIQLALQDWDQAIEDLQSAERYMTAIVGSESYRLSDIFIPMAYAEHQVGNDREALTYASEAHRLRENRKVKLEDRVSVAAVIHGAMQILNGQTESGSRLVNENIDATIKRLGEDDVYVQFANESLASAGQSE